MPRLTARLGEKELSKCRKEDKMEMAIEERIRMMRKKKAKERAATNRRMETGQPARKRRKVEESE